LISTAHTLHAALPILSYGPTPTAENADVIILNTCSIREKAEDKMLSALGRYRTVKLSRGALIGVGGCVAQQEKAKLLAKVPYVRSEEHTSELQSRENL